ERQPFECHLLGSYQILLTFRSLQR
ncbi:hypothetical protein Gotri_005681, partial [Gossypium trilobum]|nr:hypothetical protein [Gossypium trilobum]